MKGRYNYMISEKLLRQENETEDQYIDRLCTMKEVYGLTWEQVSRVANECLGINHSECWYRRRVKKIPLSAYSSMSADENSIAEALIELKKERCKLIEQRAANNREIKNEAKNDLLLEIASDYARILNDKNQLVFKDVKHVEGKKQAILQLSDWHYGIEVDSFINSYNPLICKERLSTLCAEVIRKCKEEDVDTLYITNLGDLICGRIHLTLRLESRIDVVTQIMDVSEMLAEFLAKITENEISVRYYSCLDNHSRVEPIKDQAMPLESLARITDWFLKFRLPDLEVTNNAYGPNIISFKIGNYTIGGVHGDLDKPKDVVSNITLFTRENYDLILTAHLHHFSCDERNGCVVVSNGSLMGTDDFAEKLRLSSKPSQNLIIVSDQSVIDSIHRITVD